MPEATGVLPESVKIDPSGPCFGTPFCSFGGELGTSVIKKGSKNGALDPVLELLPIRGPEGHPALRVYSSNFRPPASQDW